MEPAVSQVFSFLDAHVWLWPAFIIVARVCDVSIGTVRTILVVRGWVKWAALLGFFEVLIWAAASAGVLVDISLLKVTSYAAGFALGNATGILIEKRIGLGKQMIMLVSASRSPSVAFALRLAGFGVTQVPARGMSGKVAMCLTVVPRRKTEEVLRIARHVDEAIHATIQDVQETSLSIPTTPTMLTGWRAIGKRK
ncbi:MAG: DUF2179 domain-containing protein [Phycisphaeraceae bacterium]